jgi:hypothetical protein
MAKHKSRRRRSVAMSDMPEMPPSVTITKADNGFIVESYHHNMAYKKVAKDKPEALKYAGAMLGK